MNMAMDSKYRMTQTQLDKLVEELKHMEEVETKEVAELIKEARSFGDLSENSEYDEAKTVQGKLYSRIAEVKNLVENAVIIEQAATDKVTVGSFVTVRDLEDDSVETYHLVGSQEADPRNGRISNDSPVGRGLIGHSVHDVVEVEAPIGVLKFEITEIRN